MVRNLPASWSQSLVVIIITLLSITLFRCSSPDTKQSAAPPDDYKTGEECRLRASFDSAITYFDKSIEKSFREGAWQKWILSLNGSIDCYRGKGDLQGAFRLLDHWDSIAKNTISVRSVEYASLLHKRATLLSESNNLEQSDEYFHKALNLRRNLKLKRDTAIALIYNGLGTNCLYRVNKNEALAYYQKAVKNYDSLGLVKTADYAMFNQNAGIVYALMGNFDKAQPLFQLSLSINQSILSPNDPKLALVYLNIGNFFSLTGNDEKALELLTKSEEIFKHKDKTSLKLASVYLNLGNIYVNKANYEKALSYYNNALALIQSNQNSNKKDLLTALLNLGFIYEKKKDFATAKKYYMAGHELGDNHLNAVKILRGLANINYILNDYDSAGYYHERALKNCIDLYGADNQETALTYLKYGEFCSFTGNLQQAKDYMQKGLDIYKSVYGEKSRDVGYAYLNIANLYERNKDYSKSLEYYQRAINSGFDAFNDLDVLKNPEPDKNTLYYNQLNMISGKANVLYRVHRENKGSTEYLRASASSYELALKLMEMLRSTYQEEDSKLMIAGNEKNTVLGAIRTQVELFNETNETSALEKAFNYAEKGKSSVLLSYLRDMEAKDLGKIPDDVRKLDNKLKSDIAFYNRLLFDESSKKDASQAKINLWNTILFKLSRQHDSLIGIVESRYPAYYNLKYDNSVISLESAKKKLNKNQALIEYTLADSVVYTFVITSEQYKLFVKPLDKAFFDNLKTIREMLIGKSFNNYSPEDFRSFTAASYALYQTLLEPASSIIKGKDLIVVPDADLGYLSFDILLTRLPDAKARGYRGLSYLIKESTISYAPSATALFEGFRNPESSSNHKVLAFAPSYENIKGVKVEELLRGRTYRDYLLPIPGAQIEVNNLRKIFRSKVYDGEAATESKFKKNAGRYSILHLAMHTIINNNNPLYSKLVFFHNSDSTEDGMLNTSELFGMQLNADLAVLSACNTGTGKLEQGEGIMSLSRGFFYAGVPSIIMTSWAVEDQSGSELMSAFYKYLAEGKPKNEALRLAKIEYLENTDQLKAHPHFWAAYMNIGDISPVQQLKRPLPVIALLLGGVAILLLAALAVYLYQRRKRRAVR